MQIRYFSTSVGWQNTLFVSWSATGGSRWSITRAAAATRAPPIASFCSRRHLMCWTTVSQQNSNHKSKNWQNTTIVRQGILPVYHMYFFVREQLQSDFLCHTHYIHGTYLWSFMITCLWFSFTAARKKATYDKFGEEGLKGGIPSELGASGAWSSGYTYHGNAEETFRQFFGGDNPFAGELLCRTCCMVFIDITRLDLKLSFISLQISLPQMVVR